MVSGRGWEHPAKGPDVQASNRLRLHLFLGAPSKHDSVLMTGICPSCPPIFGALDGQR